MELACHPLVGGAARRAALFWFSICPLFSDPTENVDGGPAGRGQPHFLDHPEVILHSIFAPPDRTMHAIGDAENSTAL